jgi:hypothetical protein
VSDDELTDRWEAGPLGRPVDHEERVRIARVLIRRHGPAEAAQRLAHRIRENCNAAGVPERFDRDLTLRWIARIADALGAGDDETFEGFIRLHPELLEADLLGQPDWAEDNSERALTGGWVTSGVVQVGETVRRPPGPSAPFVHLLLEHLEAAGFEASPRFLGYDDQGRETLTFIAGDVPSDCRAEVWGDNQLEAVAGLLRRFHDVTAGSEMAADAEVVCHNDFGPWNLVWRDGLPIGIIDYDNAAPGARLDDLSYAVWKCLNLGLIDLPVTEQSRRARVFTTAYGTRPSSGLLRAIERAQERMHALIASAADSSRRSDALDQNDREREWLQAHGASLIA